MSSTPSNAPFDAPADAPADAGGPSSSASAKRRPRIGVYGGSFDPVHAGHLHAARAACSAFDLDQVVFVPAAQSPHKLERARASDADRLAMLTLAIEGEPRFAVSEIELARGGRSYTIDTIRSLPGAIGLPDAELYLILGSDTLPDFPRWREARALLELVQPIVIQREGDPERLLTELARELGIQAQAKFARGYLRLPPVRVSSTELRALPPALAAQGEKLPPNVLGYIRAHGLYAAQR